MVRKLQNTKGSVKPSSNESPEKYGLLKYHQLPEWRQMNESITTGYIPPNNSSYRECVSSMSFIHNETGGQYTHFLPFLLATAECIRLTGILCGWVDAPHGPLVEDVLAFAAFFLGAFTCMGLSTVYHMVMSHSEAVAIYAKQFDFLGIVSLIWGSLVPTIYYAFTCEVPLMKKYLTTVRPSHNDRIQIAYRDQITIISVIMTGLLLSPLARQSWSGALITPGFVALAGSAVVPLTHAVQLYGWQRMCQMVGMEYIAVEAVLYGIGLFCLVVRIFSSLKQAVADK